MRVALAVVICASTYVLWAGHGVDPSTVPRPADVPPLYTARQLLDETSYPPGYVVRLSTAGLEPWYGTTEYVYRRRATGPPLLVVRMERSFGRLPPVVLGVVKGPSNPLVLSGCVPAE